MKGHLTVADVMTSDVASVWPHTSYKEIARTLDNRGVSAVPVIDYHGYVVGVVSETDLLRKEEHQAPWRSRRLERRGNSADRAKAGAIVAGELMTTPAVCIGLGASLPTAARMMADHAVTRLIVVNSNGSLAGIVSRSDLLRVFLSPDDELCEVITRRLVRHALWQDPYAVHVDVRDGVALLTGELERRSLVQLAGRFAGTVDGVVGVRNRLAYIVDDTDSAIQPLVSRFDAA